MLIVFVRERRPLYRDHGQRSPDHPVGLRARPVSEVREGEEGRGCGAREGGRGCRAPPPWVPGTKGRHSLLQRRHALQYRPGLCYTLCPHPLILHARCGAPMAIAIDTFAEQQAVTAENLPAFSGLKVLHIKRQVAAILKQIGGDGIFDAYTRHDISHIDEMLKALDWLIPQETKRVISPADWLMIVLSIYFHDMGMLVTHDEFANRDRSGFAEYRDQVLFADAAGTDYKAKISALEPEKAERFLYQEFVRAKHGERIRNWISGKASDSLGVAQKIVSEIDSLLAVLDPQFRQELGLVCESHHLDDLDDFEKYSLSRPYGNSAEETANLQFAAIVLRTSDLLHITRDRTPAVAFRLINPSDPQQTRRRREVPPPRRRRWQHIHADSRRANVRFCLPQRRRLRDQSAGPEAEPRRRTRNIRSRPRCS
jgi:hypothetical protein